MTDEITQNDCQGETCPQCGGKGFRTEDGGNSFRVCECSEIWPNETAAHANGFEMGYRAHTEVIAAELERLKAELTEAREIMKRVDGEMFEMGHRLPCMAALRAFLTKGEKND